MVWGRGREHGGDGWDLCEFFGKQLEIHDEVLQDIDDYRNLVREKPYQFVRPRHVEMVERLNRDRGNA